MRAFTVKVALFVLVVVAIVLTWFLIGHGIAVIVFAAALVGLVARKILIFRLASGRKKF